MSEGPDWKVPESQPENIHWKVVISSIVGTLALFTGSVFVVWLIVHADWNHRNPKPSIPAALRHPTINLLETVTFPLATLTYQEKQRQRLRLAGWGWASREQRLIHIPIEDAIDDLLAGKGPLPRYPGVRQQGPPRP